MVFRHLINMVGEIDDCDKRKQNAEETEEVFLLNLAQKVNKHSNSEHAYSPEEKADNLGRVSGFAIGIGSLYLQEVLGYPFVVIRRQCQLNSGSYRYHILPFTLIPIISKINQRQGAGVFWKGWGSTCIVTGSTIVSEVLISDLVHVPRKAEIKLVEESVPWKTVLVQELLKGISMLLTLPLLSASLVDTVQSNALDEPRSVFEFLRDAARRVIGSYTSRGHGRLLPLYSLTLPSIVYGVVRHTVKSVATSVLLRITRQRYGITEETTTLDNMEKVYYAELVSNITASLVTEALLYPLETVMVRLHVQGMRTIIDDTDKGVGVVPLCSNYSGVKDCFHVVRREEGVAGFYKGFGALLLQYTLQAALVRLAKPCFYS